jgi:hypothetical protein
MIQNPNVRERWMPASPEEHSEVLHALEVVLASPSFCNSKRYPALLRYVVEQTLLGHGMRLRNEPLASMSSVVHLITTPIWTRSFATRQARYANDFLPTTTRWIPLSRSLCLRDRIDRNLPALWRPTIQRLRGEVKTRLL